MISILFAALCVAYDASNNCIDRMVLPAGQWEGPTAPVECEAEAVVSRKRLEAEGHDRHFVIWCESQTSGE